MKHNKFLGLAYVRAALGLLLCIGTVTFLQPCMHDDGNFGTCHWAGRMLTGLGIVLTLQAAIAMLPCGAKWSEGLSLSMLPVTLFTALVPGIVIPLCRMQTMRCNMVMKPSTVLIAVLIGVLSAVDVVIQHKRAQKGGE